MTSDLFLGRSLLDWRDACLISAEEAFTRAAFELEVHLSESFSKTGLPTATFGVERWMRQVADPAVEARIGATWAAQEDKARRALAQIVAAAPEFARREGRLSVAGATGTVALDLASAGAPLALAGLVLGATPGLAVSTVTAWLGLSVVTTVSTPVVLGAVGVGALLVGTGATRALGLRRRLDDRQTARLRAALRSSILDAPGSHLDLFQRSIQAACDRLTKGIPDDTAPAV